MRETLLGAGIGTAIGGAVMEFFLDRELPGLEFIVLGVILAIISQLAPEGD